MKRASDMTAILLGILLLSMAASKEWISDVWRQMQTHEKILWALIFSIAIGSAFVVGVVPIVWEWGNYLLNI